MLKEPIRSRNRRIGANAGPGQFTVEIAVASLGAKIRAR